MAAGRWWKALLSASASLSVQWESRRLHPPTPGRVSGGEMLRTPEGVCITADL